MQSPVVGCRKLAEQVSDLEHNSVELDTWRLLYCRRTVLTFINLLHNHPLTFFGQTDEVIVVSIQDQWLW